MTTAARFRILVTAGFIGMILGGMDPMEGSVIIVPGCGLVLLGVYLGGYERSMIVYRAWVFVLTAIGVAALWGLSVAGGIGGASDFSMWWGLLILPYPFAWSAGIWGPGSPRWVLWLGIGVSAWYLAIFYMTLRSTLTTGANETHITGFLLGIIGVLTISGCIYRLRKGNA